MAPVTWSIGPDSSRWLRLCWYAGLSVWLGFALMAVSLAGLVAVGGLLVGDPGPALLVGLLVFVGGPLSILYLWPMVREADQRPAFLSPPRWARARWLAVGAMAVAAVVVILPIAAIGLVILGMVAPLVGSVLRSEGELDETAGTLLTNGRSVDLREVRTLSRLHVGSIALCWLRYRRASGMAMAPRLLAVPSATVPQLVAAIAAAEPPPVDSEADAPRSSRLVQIVLVLLGLGSLAVGGALLLLGPVPPAIALWGGALFGIFGALFLWLGYAER